MSLATRCWHLDPPSRAVNMTGPIRRSRTTRGPSANAAAAPDLLEEEPEDAPAGHLFGIMGPMLMSAFSEHSEHLQTAEKERKRSLMLRANVNDWFETHYARDGGSSARARCHSSDQPHATSADLAGTWLAGDEKLSNLRALLSKVDNRGYERSAHQMAFHSAFERSTARVIYREDWARSRHAIMQKNGWKLCSSEVLISTPRRFGKTFRRARRAAPAVPSAPLTPDASRARTSIAIYVAAMALALSCEVVVFSPARRASRKLLERIVE
jgi:hypothetical protein